MTQMSKQEYHDTCFQQTKPEPEVDTSVPLWVWFIGLGLVALVWMIFSQGVH
jgi:hypothetical protein